MTHANEELTLDRLDEVSGGGTDPWVHPRTPWEIHQDIIHSIQAVENTTVMEARTTLPL
jgi:hypothetical protein